MEEVVARRANLIAAYIFLMAFGSAVILIGIIANINLAEEYGDWTVMLFFLGIGLVIIAAGIIGLLVYLKMPKVYITYKDGKLYFSDGTECYPHEVEHVLVKLTRTNGIESSTGGLVITVYGRKIEYKAVRQVKAAEKRLEELYNRSREEYRLQHLKELEKEAEEISKAREEAGKNSDIQN